MFALLHMLRATPKSASCTLAHPCCNDSFKEWAATADFIDGKAKTTSYGSEKVSAQIKSWGYGMQHNSVEFKGY
jgi:hypothetical protein